MLKENDIEDPRLRPLFDNNSVVALQFFVLEINNKKVLTKDYKIAYAWCIKSTRPDIDNTLFCGTPISLYSSVTIAYSVHRVSFYNTPKQVIEFITRLTNYESLNSISASLGIDSSQLKFDVQFIKDKTHQKSFAIRPLIYNETNTLISRNFYQKYSLNSPFKNVPSVSLVINNLDKIGLMKNAASEFYPDWQIALLKILDCLKIETSLPFNSSGASRFGNIEFLNSQCCNEFEVHNVWFENHKDTVKINHKDVSSCKKVSLTILDNDYTCNKKLVVNCFLTNGDQVIYDECKEYFHTLEKPCNIEFECKEQITNIAVSVWVEGNGSYHIWYKHSIPLIRTISSNIGMVGTSGALKSEWLTTIQNSNKKTIESVREAEKISKTSYSRITIEDFDLDPWVSADRIFVELVTRLNPPKSEAQFFPKGWEETTAEYGAISFLEWFKEITQHAQKVVIQDPFFDTLGLEFIARTTNSNTQFQILTCTQVASNDDTGSFITEPIGKLKIKQLIKKYFSILNSVFKYTKIASTDGTSSNIIEPNRAFRIKQFIKNYPSILNSIKLDIYDLRSIGGGNKNLLHDRYMFIFQNDTLIKGFHLSNSIQGATKYSPLLVTPIPLDVLVKVNLHIEETINQTIADTEKEIVQLVEKANLFPSINKEKDKPANQVFFDELKNKISSEAEITEEKISFIIDKLTLADDQNFLALWSTIGYFIANSTFADELLAEISKEFSPSLIQKLSCFIQSTITTPSPIGFSDTITYHRNSYHNFFENNFEKSLENAFRHYAHFGESDSFSNWGTYYGSRILLKTSFEEFITLIPFLKEKFEEKKRVDLLKSPIPKLNTIVFNCLIENFFWYKDLTNIEIALKSNITCLRALATAALIANSVERESKLSIDKAIELITLHLSCKEALQALCKMLMEHKKVNQNIIETTESKCIEAITKLLSDNYSGDFINMVCSVLIDTEYPFIDKKLVDGPLKHLIDGSKIHSDKIFEIWSVKFIAMLKKAEKHINYSGILDITGHSLCFVSKNKLNTFLLTMKNQCRNDFHEIRKPFKKNSTSWDIAFNRLLLIQSVLAISLLHNDKNMSKMDETKKIRSMIEEIQILNEQFMPNDKINEIHAFSKQVMEKYSKITI